MKDLRASILSVSTGHPEKSFTQEEIRELMNIRDEKRARFFHHPHVKKRHFFFDGNFREETFSEQRKKFRDHAPVLSAEVLGRALAASGLAASDIGCLIAVTASGSYTPGLSVMVASAMKLHPSVYRLDLSGIGCHAGLTGLQAAANWCQSNPGKTAALLCAELGSTIYNLETSDNNALVNSLFGDGVAALIVRAEEKNPGPRLLGFRTHLIPQTEEHLHFKWIAERNLFGFHVDKRTPEVLGPAVAASVKTFLRENKLSPSDISEWVVHGGGEAILSSVQGELGLSDEALRHTRSVLSDFGNVASGSFIFSYERLLREKKPAKGQYLMFMAMGPGLTLELALAEWP